MDWPEHPFFAHSVSPADFSSMRKRTGAPASVLVGAAQMQTAHFFPFEPLAR